MNLIEKMEQRLQKIQRSLRNGVDGEQIIALSSHESGFLTAFSIVKNHNPWQSPETKPPSEQFVQAIRNGVWGVARYDERFDYWIFRSPQHHFYNPVFSIDKWKFIDEAPHDKPSD